MKGLLTVTKLLFYKAILARQRWLILYIKFLYFYLEISTAVDTVEQRLCANDENRMRCSVLAN